MIRFVLIISLCFLYIFHELFTLSVLKNIYLIVCTSVFLTAILHLNKREKVITGILFFLGVTLHYYQGYRGIELLLGINQNMPILCILILAPLVSIPLKQEGLLDGVIDKLQEQKDNYRSTFYRVGSFTMILAPILNMGALRIVDEEISKLHLPSKLLSHSYYGAVTPAFIWSPFYASVGTVLYLTEMSYMSYMLIGIGFALMQIIVGVLMLRPKNQQIEKVKKQEVNKEDRKKLFKLIAFIIILLITLIFEEAFINQPMLFLVSINCLLVPILWGLISRKWKELKTEIIAYKNRTISKSNAEIGLFLSAGLFGNALVQTPITGVLEDIIIWSSSWSILLLFIFLIVIMMIMAMLGIHQIIVVPVIITILISPNIDVNFFAISFMCVFAWMLSAAISPINPLNVIISQCVGKNGLTVALKWNGKYFLAVTGAAFVYVCFLNYIG